MNNNTGNQMTNEKILAHYYELLKTASTKVEGNRDLSDFSETVHVIAAISVLLGARVDYKRIRRIIEDRNYEALMSAI